MTAMKQVFSNHFIYSTKFPSLNLISSIHSLEYKLYKPVCRRIVNGVQIRTVKLPLIGHPYSGLVCPLNILLKWLGSKCETSYLLNKFSLPVICSIYIVHSYGQTGFVVY